MNDVEAPPPVLKLPPERRSLALRATAWIYLAFMILVPLSAVLHDGLREGVGDFWANVSRPTAWHALKLSVWTGAVMAVLNAVIGTMTAYVLVRYDFPGKRIVNVLVDLPFAVPTLVTGVMLVLIYGPQGAVGGWLDRELGWRVLFSPPGIILALLFVNYPIVVRTVQPVLAEVDVDQEDAARTMGATPGQTFARVLLPAIGPAVASGFLLSFARALGEFGSIVMVAGNIPMRSQTAAVYVLSQIESENQRGASAMSVVLLGVSFTVILFTDAMQRKREARLGRIIT